MIADSSLIILFSAVIIVGVILFAVVTLTKRGGTLDVDKYRSRWLAIEQSVTKGKEPTYHMAILNADKLLDQAMRDLGIKGQTMGDRLKFAKSRWSNRNSLWMAHKLRNQIAHEQDIAISYSDVRAALAGFKQALKDLGAI